MQYLLLARHGNTFAAGQKTVWVSSRNDLPLVETGIAQAHLLGQVLKKLVIIPQSIYCGSLKRTIVYAQILKDELGLKESINIDDRLNEIDYGSWSGLTNDEIKTQYGQDELDKWNKYGLWNESFIGAETEVENDVLSFIQETIINNPSAKNLMAVTSNGRLKYFLKLIPDIYNDYIEKAKWKVATGNVCLLSYNGFKWKVICWNESPQLLATSAINTRF